MRDGSSEMEEIRHATCEVRDERQEIRDTKWRAARRGARDITVDARTECAPPPAMCSNATRDARRDDATRCARATPLWCKEISHFGKGRRMKLPGWKRLRPRWRSSDTAMGRSQ